MQTVKMEMSAAFALCNVPPAQDFVQLMLDMHLATHYTGVYIDSHTLPLQLACR